MTGKELSIRPGMLKRIEGIVRYFKDTEDPTIAGAASDLGICYDTAKDRLRKAVELGYISKEFHEGCKIKVGRPAERTYYPRAVAAEEDPIMRKAVRMRKRGATLQEIAEAIGKEGGKSYVFYMLARAIDEGLLTARQYDKASEKNRQPGYLR